MRILRVLVIALTFLDTVHLESNFGNLSALVLDASPYYQENTVWTILTNIAIDVFRFQNEMDSLMRGRLKTCTVVTICDNSHLASSTTFMDAVARHNQGTQFINLQLGNTFGIMNVSDALDILMKNDAAVSTVAVFAENGSQVAQILETVSSLTSFRWTSVIHVTEWILVSTSSGLLEELQVQHPTIDFVTVILSTESDFFTTFQKSRGSEFTQVFNYTFSNKRASAHNTSTVERPANFGYINDPDHLRLHPLRFLKTQKSIMAGLSIPAAISVKNYKRISYQETVNNVTTNGGFSVELMKLMAATLGFRCHFVPVSDGGGYGEAKSNGTVTGITGLLARRETGIAALVSRLENRARVIDFLPTILIEETSNIVYRLPKAGESLDLTYIKIIEPEFLLLHIGPVLMIAIIGALVHVATRECSSAEPEKFSLRDLQRLRSFLSHVFFLEDNYPSHTGRILIGTWGIFCLVLWSAYSAYLVTTFATKPNELAIRTFEQLLQHNEYKIGMLGSGNALAIILKASSDKWMRQLWLKLLDYNKTDPLTFSLELNDHVQRLVSSRYAFIDNFSIASGLFYDYLPPNYTDVRAYVQYSLQGAFTSYIALPKNVFYKETLYQLHLQLEAAGVVFKLQKIFFSNTNQDASRNKHDGSVVGFARIEFLVYVAVAGAIISFVCLGAEIALAWWNSSPARNKSTNISCL